MHQQNCSYGRLRLAVTFFGPVDGIGFQDAIEVLLPVMEKDEERNFTETFGPYRSSLFTRPNSRKAEFSVVFLLGVLF